LLFKPPPPPPPLSLKLLMDVPTGQSRLVQFGFRRLTKEEIQQKTTDRAALYNPVAVKEKQDALREASKVKAEEAAAAKADAARYLNMKRQKRFRDRERKKKAMTRTCPSRCGVQFQKSCSLASIKIFS